MQQLPLPVGQATQMTYAASLKGFHTANPPGQNQLLEILVSSNLVKAPIPVEGYALPIYFPFYLTL